MTASAKQTARELISKHRAGVRTGGGVRTHYLDELEADIAAALDQRGDEEWNTCAEEAVSKITDLRRHESPYDDGLRDAIKAIRALRREAKP